MAATNVQAFSGDVTISSNLAVDTNTLFVDSVANRVGIGTTATNTSSLHVFRATGASISVESSDAGTYSSIEMGGPQGALLDFKSPFSDDYDSRIQYNVDSGPNGQLVFLGSNVAFDTNTLFVNSVGNNVGIGVTDPTYQLDLLNNIRIRGNYPALYFSEGTPAANIPAFRLYNDGASQNDNNNYLAIQRHTGSSVYQSIIHSTYGGLVGIGTDAPAAALHVQTTGSGATGGTVILNPALNSANIGLFLGKAVGTGTCMFMNYTHSGTDDSVDNTANFGIFSKSTNLTLKGDGNVGIGTTDPGARLDVRGNHMIFDKAKGDGTILTGLYNLGSTQAVFIDAGVQGGAGTTTASTAQSPPPGTAGDVICAFQNNAGGEAVTNPFNPGSISGVTGDVFTFSLWTLASLSVDMEFFINPGGTGSAAAAFNVPGDGNWHFRQMSLTMSGSSSMFFRVDNNSGGRLVYVTGVAIRKNATSGVDLPFTPRYSPHDGIGSVFATQNLVAKEAAIKTLTGNVGIGTSVPARLLDVHGNARFRRQSGWKSGTYNANATNMGPMADTDMPQIGWEYHMTFSTTANIAKVKIYGAYRSQGALYGLSEGNTWMFTNGSAESYLTSTEALLVFQSNAGTASYHAVIRVLNSLYTNADAGAYTRHHFSAECIGTRAAYGATLLKSTGYFGLGTQSTDNRFNYLRVTTDSSEIKGQWTAFPITTGGV